MSRLRAPLALTATSLALLTGCGTTFVLRSGRTLELAVTEYRIAPQSIRTSAGPLTILVQNDGRLTHNLAISSGGQLDAATRPIWPGETAEMTVTLPPGRYVLASTILSDQALGAYGTLTLR